MFRSIALAASTVLVSGAAAAAPITYNATLSNGVPVTGTISDTNTASDPVGAQYYRFFANAGSEVTVIGSRLDANYDMAFWLFQGEFADTDEFGGSFDSGDAGYIDFADDEIPHPGPFGDPQSIFTAATSGFYTVAVTNFASGDSENGFFSFELVARGIQNVPEPGSLFLAGLGLLGLAGLRRARAS